MKRLKERNLHSVFEVSVILKGIHAVIEIIISFAVLFITPAFIDRSIFLLTQEELTEDPKDVISNYLVYISHHISFNSQLFGFIYLFSHGIIKLFLVYFLLKKKLWAYPASIAALILFIVYQIYRYALTHSIWLIALTVFDLIVLWLIWHEYNFIKRNLLFKK